MSRPSKSAAPTGGGPSGNGTKGLEGFLNEFDDLLKLIGPARDEVKQAVGNHSTVADAKLELHRAYRDNEILAIQEDNDGMAKLAEEKRKEYIQLDIQYQQEKLHNERLQKDIDACKKLHGDERGNSKELKAQLSRQKTEIEELKISIKNANQETKDALETIKFHEAALQDLKSKKGSDQDVRELTEQETSELEHEVSDQNLCSKVASMYDYLYNNQWVDVFVATEKIYPSRSDFFRISKICILVQSIHKFCQDELKQENIEILQLLSHKNQESSRPLADLDRLLNGCRKQISDVDIEPTFAKLNDKSEKCNRQLSKLVQQVPEFSRECLRLCWTMLCQHPQMVFADPPTYGEAFDGKQYKPYTVAGDKVEYVVWPAILKHRDGPLVAKGVVQCYKSPGYQTPASDRKTYARTSSSEPVAGGEDPLHTKSGNKSEQPGNDIAAIVPPNTKTHENTEESQQTHNKGMNATYPKELTP